ncbi:MAG: divalent metal cation transporter [Saprospiraceae bacterium]
MGVVLGAAEGRKTALRSLLFGAVALGCGAYQAGNLLGAMAGLSLLWDGGAYWLLLLVALAAILLWSGSTRLITRSLAIIVALMGVVFFAVGARVEVAAHAWWQGLMPQVQSNNVLLVMGLIGTTIVPYNLFLGSGLKHAQTLGEMRAGLLLAIVIGGGITLAIMLTGTSLAEETFSFPALAAALDQRFPGYGRSLLGLGLFAAGFSSAITAPLLLLGRTEPFGTCETSMGRQGALFSTDLGRCVVGRVDIRLDERTTHSCHHRHRPPTVSSCRW